MGVADDRFIDDVVAAMRAGMPKGVPAVRVSIPMSHPKAESIWKLSCLLATTQEYPGGIRVSGLSRPDSVDEFLAELRRLGVLDVETLLARLAVAEPRFKTPSMVDLVHVVAGALPVLVRHGALSKIPT
jgi:hypothetical protein